MKAATVSEIRRELKTLPAEQLVELCLRMARFKKDNKELLNYILYESLNEEAYVSAIQEEIEEDFELMNARSVYLAKKTIRKVLRKIDKYVRYSGLPETEIAINIHFLRTFVDSGLAIRKSKVLVNIYERRMALIRKALGKLHEDIQFDYNADLEELKSLLRG